MFTVQSHVWTWMLESPLFFEANLIKYVQQAAVLNHSLSPFLKFPEHFTFIRFDMLL